MPEPHSRPPPSPRPEDGVGQPSPEGGSSFQGPPSSPLGSLRVQTLELLWHYREGGEEFEHLGLQGSSLAEGITSIDSHPRQNCLLTTGGDQCIRLWQLDDDALERWLCHNSNNPNSPNQMDRKMSDMMRCCRHLSKMTSMWMPLTARWSPSGTLFASGHCEGRICLWWDSKANANFSGEEEDDGHHSNTHPVPSTAGLTAVDNEESGEFREEWKDYRHLVGHVGDVYDLVFSPDGRYIFSGASDGSIAIHDIESGGSAAVGFWPNQHGKFCCGVAWDPWGAILHSFGASPGLWCYRNVPAQRPGGRMHLVSQRRCQGDFLGEPDALAFRRIGWSPDGLFLAVPFGKVAQGSPDSTANRLEMESKMFSDAIEAKLTAGVKRQGEKVVHDAEEAIYANEEVPQVEEVVMESEEDNCNESSAVNSPHATLEAKKQPTKSSKNKSCWVNHSAKGDNDERDMVHCVNIYLRNAPEKLAARLVIRGYNELRGVLWAPYFLEPLPPKEPSLLVLENPLRTAEAETSKLSLNGRLLNGEPFYENPFKASDSKAVNSTVETNSTTQGGGFTTFNNNNNNNDTPYGGWGPSDYRMALAVWTCDSVLVYTSDSCVRHSDFTDLHARNITDVCWGKNARFLLTASLDGYVSVIRFGSSLTPAHRLPIFSNRPVTILLTKMLRKIRKSSETERQRGRKAEGGGEYRHGCDQDNTIVAAVRKKKKTEAADPLPTHPSKSMNTDTTSDQPL